MAEPRIHTWVTYVLIAANVAMFGFELAIGADPMSPATDVLIEAGANFGPLTTNGEWWRLVTAMFLHIGLLHLALNMVCLWQGRVVEVLYGRGAFVALYVLAGIAGSLASVVRSPFNVSAGASGAVFGVYGAFGAFLVMRRSIMDPNVWHTTAKGIGLFVVINLVFGLSVPAIDMAAHVGGLVVGFLVGMALLWKGERRPTRRRTIAVALGVAALLGAATFVVPEPFNPKAHVQFLKTNLRVTDVWEDLLVRVEGKAIGDADAARVVERDILKPWRAAHDELREAAEHAEGRWRPLLAAFDRFATARDQAWRTYVAWLRATGDEREALHLRFVGEWRASIAAAQEVDAETERMLAPQ